MREDLLRQFSSADGSNPLADFKAAHLRAARDAAAPPGGAAARRCASRWSRCKLELQKLQAEREKALEVAAEHARSTAKGRPYEEAVVEAVDAIAARPGRRLRRGRATSAAPAAARATCWSTSTAAPAPPRGRIVFEAKNSRRSRKEALAELDEAMAQRDADYGVWVVPSEDRLPARAHGAARGRRRQAVRGLRPRGRLAAGPARSPTRWPARAC